MGDLLFRTMNIRNEDLQFKVFGILINFYNSAEFRNRFDTLMEDKRIAYAKLGILLLVELSQGVEEELFQGSVKTFQDMMPHLRPAWKNKETGLELLFLKTVFTLLNSPMSPEKKWRFITKICSFVTEKEDWKVFRQCLFSVQLLNIYEYFSDAEEEKESCEDFLTSDFSSEDLFALVTGEVKEKLFAGRELSAEETRKVEGAAEILSTQRIPFAIEYYAQEIQKLDNEALNDAMQRFVLSILTDRFLEERYDSERSPHLKKLAEEHNELWERWKSREMLVLNDIESGAGQLEAKITDDWQDLFLSGTEVLDSCQTIYGDVIYNKGLLAYCMDGKIQMAEVKDKKTGKILSRTIFKLLFKEDGTPVLFVGRIYPIDYCPVEQQELLRELAKKRAKQLGIELYSCIWPLKKREIQEPETKKLQSLGTTVPFEYEDETMLGRTLGKYLIVAPRIL